MPNTEVQGASVGVYGNLNGSQTLLAGRRNVELSDTADTLDSTHADNLRVGGPIESATTSEITVSQLLASELELAKRGEIVKASGGTGDYTWDASDVTDNNDGTVTVTVNGDPSGADDGLLYVPSPHGNRTFIYDRHEWELSLENVMIIDQDTGAFEASQRALQRIHRHGEIVEVRFVYPTRNDSPPRDEGEAFITDFTTGANNGDLATASMTLTGREKLEYVTP
jgi:hypothetical protein